MARILVKLADLVLDPDLQVRAEMNRDPMSRDAIARYAQMYKTKKPPVEPVAFRLDGRIVLAAGFKRVTAAREAGLTEIWMDVRTGSRRDALVEAVESNLRYKWGVAMTIPDRHRAVRLFLANPELAEESTSWIADKCDVARETVEQIRTKSASCSPLQDAPAVQQEGASCSGLQDAREDGQDAGNIHGKNTGNGASQEGASCSPLQDAPDAEKTKKRVRKVHRKGRTYQMDTAKIGSKSKKKVTADANGQAGPEATEPPGPPEPDDLGIPIQPHALLAFEARAKFDELEKTLRAARKLYNELASHPGGAYLLRPGVSINAKDSWKNKGIEDAILACKDNRPSLTECPYAHNPHLPHGECSLCHGLNWTRPLEKGRVSQELLDAMKADFNVK